MSHLNELTRKFWTRLLQNLPAGYTVADVINVDCDIEKTISTKHLVQRTQLGLRQQTARDTKRCIRQYFIHTIGVYVDNANIEDKIGIMTTVSEIQTAFEKLEFSDYKTQSAEPDVFGKQSDSKFYRVDININGYYEEIL